MKFSEDKIQQGYYISGYEPGVILVNGNPKTQSFIISDTRLIEGWAPGHIDALRAEHLELLIELQPELVILGTGAVLKFPSMGHYARLIEQNIGVEIMDSDAACRTYNILLGEGRKVVAGIIINARVDDSPA